ncbi:spore coat protein [Anoxybacteroides tepidamans]|uniref:spore coat protein n=1 Tax=Anoxybacteroides tepidamans TaxID=265948 RepID=UPI001E65DA77|nr:spore coat protein [Anoxybacillus tepidamans]
MNRSKKWRALDHCTAPGCNNEANTVAQEAEQKSSTEQQSFEWIIIKDSEGVDVQTTDTQAAVSLQVGIQAAIAAVISVVIGDTEQGNAVAQQLSQLIRTRQKNTQKTIIEGSRNVQVVTTDTDVAINIQALLQILIAVVLRLEIL